MTKVYKIELFVVDHANYGIDGTIEALENDEHLHTQVLTTQSVDVGDWDDQNPLNRRSTARAEIKRLFG